MDMNKIDKKLGEIKSRKRIGLMTHVVVGYPSLDETVTIVKTMAENGVDFVELQIPFSDPLVDGTTIMKACEESLSNGTKVADAFKIMKKLSLVAEIPLLFMSYYNTVFQYGVEEFCKDAKETGASGLIVPDMPIDEEDQEHFYEFAKKYDLHTIQVISPASTNERLEKNTKIANGFVYCTARQGTTGAKTELDPTLVAYLNRVKQFVTTPIAVGFGISKKEHIQALQGIADIAVIGSAIIDIVAHSAIQNRTQKIADFISGLKMLR